MLRGETIFLTKTDAIANRLREDIIGGRLARGTPLLQDKLAADFRTSITPVREAMRELESEGYLVSAPHLGMTVAPLLGEDLEEAYRLRILLESEAIRKAVAVLTDVDIQALQRISSEMRQAVRKRQHVEARVLNHRFHSYVYTLGQRLAPRLINILWARFPFEIIYRDKRRLYPATSEHDEIVAALRERDARAATRALRQHIDEGWRRYLEQSHANAALVKIGHNSDRPTKLEGGDRQPRRS